MYQTDKVFLIGLNCVMFLQHFLQNKKEEVKDKCKYKRAAQEKKATKIKSACILCVLHTSIYALLA
jgi:hypothetical protein